MTRRSLLKRSGVLVALALLSMFLFYIGKGHTLLIDTNAVTIDGKEFRSAETIEVSIDGKEPESMGRAERVQVLVGGPSHTITIEVVSGDERKVEKKLTLPTFMETAVISVPAILGDASPEHWIKPFVPPELEDSPAEQMVHESDASETTAPGSDKADPASR